MGRLEQHHRDLRLRDSLECAAPVSASARQKTFKDETTDGESRNAKSRQDRAWAWDRLYRNTRFGRERHEVDPWVAHQRSPRIAHQCVLSPVGEFVHDLEHLIVVAVRVKRTQRGRDAMLRAKRTCMAGILGENQVRLHSVRVAPAA